MVLSRHHCLRRAALLAAFGCCIATAAPCAPDDLRLRTFEIDGRAGDAGFDNVSRLSDSDTAFALTATGLSGAAGSFLGCALVFLAMRRRFGKAQASAASDDMLFQTLAAQANDVVLRVRRTEVVFVVDRALGYGTGTGPSLDQIVDPSDLPMVERAVAALTPATASVPISCRLRRSDGATSWMEGAIGRTGSGDHGDDVVATLRDVTHHRQETERLGRALDEARDTQTATDAASRAKSDFLASMSHEIRTPLNAIMGFADLLLDDRDLGPKGRRSAERIKAGGDALLTILNDVLDYSQLGSGALRLNPRPFVLPLLIDECIALVEGLAVAKNLALRVELTDRFPPGVMGDEARLRQIILNLVNNAIKFTPHGSVTVRIRFDRAAGPNRVLFEISDTGIGIAPDDLPKLFQRFRQVDNTMRRTHGGTGLGLAISKMLVEMMGGEIGVRSVKGSGSTFWFALDLPAVPLILEAERKPARPVAVRRLKILLVEDTRLNQELARAILEARNHDVDVVDDGAEAIMAVADKTYDLVLMDVQMPHVDGLTATRAIRILPGPARFVPIVAMTANVMPAQIAAMRESGMDDVLGKPLSMDSIDALLERAGRGAVRAVPDAQALDGATLASLKQTIGDARIEIMLATLVMTLSRRFVLPIAPDTVARLKADAQASVATTAMLGFKRFSALCRRFIDADGVPSEIHEALLSELDHVVALAQTAQNAPQSPGLDRSAA